MNGHGALNTSASAKGQRGIYGQGQWKGNIIFEYMQRQKQRLNTYNNIVYESINHTSITATSKLFNIADYYCKSRCRILNKKCTHFAKIQSVNL